MRSNLERYAEINGHREYAAKERGELGRLLCEVCPGGEVFTALHVDYDGKQEDVVVGGGI
jgi:hypothetical protein